MKKARCVGGPFDGEQVELGTRLGRFAYLGWRRDGKGVKTYDKPAPSEKNDRHLYKAEMWELGDRAVAWVYAENQVYRCRNCGAFTPKAEGGSERPECHICGT